MRATFFSSALLFFAIGHLTSAQDNVQSGFNPTPTPQLVSAATTADSAAATTENPILESVAVAIESIIGAYSTANPSLFDAAESAIPTDASDQFYSDVIFNPTASDVEAFYSTIPSQYVGLLTSIAAAEVSAVTAIVGSAIIPGVTVTDATGSTTVSPTLFPTPSNTAAGTVETLTTSATVSGSASGLTTITTAPKSSGASTASSGSSSGSSSRTVSAASGASTASTTGSTAAAAPMQTGGLTGMVVAAVGMVGVAML